ncbi:rhodanese-like domain-containing protein [Promineifilum sp.]|uniref:rhodanese-like domain-containing protein n=1 Tax=Promineifilum sp. TaxID=2664178 RepID=UPI0035B15985
MGLLDALLAGKVPSVSPDEAYRRLQADARVVIVDVRQPVETRAGVIPGAVLIPLTEFGGRLAELPRDRPILTICRSSHRSPIAARQLKRAGYDVTDVSGGMIAWKRAGLPIAPC